ncbi:MAG TPA: hypothetical protein VF115_02850 [Acidimicrobiia bacterium]
MSGFAKTDRASRAHNMVQITGTDGAYTVYRDCRRLASGSPVPDLMASAIASLNFAAIDQCRLFAVHSGVVANGDRILALPALSGHGKTTLTAALVREGFEYLSDEALVFEDGGTVIPYPKPFALSEWSADLLGVPVQGEETLATASDLDGKVGKGGRLTDLILSEYGHEDVTLEPLPRSRAVAALIEYSFNHYKDPARAFRISTEVARDLNVWRLEYDNPIEAAELLAVSLPKV